MEIIPIKCGFVNLKKSNHSKKPFLIGIDSSSLTTKIIFLHKDSKSQILDDSCDTLTLNYGIFNTEDFSKAVTWARTWAYIPESTEECIHITGHNYNHNRRIVESIFGLRTEYIDEKLSFIAGYRIALEKIGLEHLIAAPVEVPNPGKIDSKMMEKITDGYAAKFIIADLHEEQKEPSVFPCLVNDYDSQSKYYYFDEEGRGEIVGYSLQGESTYLGLAKCIFDNNNFDEISRLATAGDRGNIDTQVKDVMIEAVDSPYGIFPPDLPIFPFGKCVDLNKGTEDCKNEDLATSLAGYFSFLMFIQSAEICLMQRIPKIYLTGTIFRSDIFQKEIKRCMMIFPSPIQLEILDFANFGALGAMLCDNSDKEAFCRTK